MMKRWGMIALACAAGGISGALAIQWMRAPAPKPPDADLFEQGTAAVFAGDYSRAVEVFEAIEKGHPASERIDSALFWRAFSLRALGRAQEAQALYERIARDYPRSARAPEAELAAAEILERDLKKPAAALERYGEIAKNHPEVDYKAMANSARIQEEQKQIDEACKGYGDAWNQATNARNLPPSNYVASRARGRGDFLKANSDFEGKPLELYLAAEAMVREGKPLEAAGKLQELIAAYPTSSLIDEALSLQGKLFQELGMIREAQSAQEKLQELNKAAGK